MLEMLLNLQPQGFTEGKVLDGGEEKAEKLLQELGLEQSDEIQDFVSMLKGEQQALTKKGAEQVKEVALELASSDEELASELGLEVLAKLSSRPDDAPAKQTETLIKTAKANRPPSLLEKLGLMKEAPSTEKATESKEALSELSRLRSHGPELSMSGPSKSKSMGQKPQESQKPQIMSTEEFLGQKQLKSAEPEVAREVNKSKVSAQMLQKYENGQKVVDRQIVSLKAPTQGAQTSAEEGLKSPIELEVELQNSDSSKTLKDVGVMKVPDAPKAAGNNANNIDMGKPNILDMGKLDMNKPQQVIDKITEYIDKAQFDRTQKLDLVVKHEKLGQFQMQVSKSEVNSELIDLKIQAQGSEAHKFFKEHELDLMKSLTKNGIRLGELKLSQATESSSFAQNSENNKDSQSGQGQKFSQSGERNKDQSNQDSQRRKSLWEQFQEKQGA